LSTLVKTVLFVMCSNEYLLFLLHTYFIQMPVSSVVFRNFKQNRLRELFAIHVRFSKNILITTLRRIGRGKVIFQKSCQFLQCIGL
jgi:hypothetical protein